MKKKIIIILVVVFILSAIAAAILFFMKKRNNNNMDMMGEMDLMQEPIMRGTIENTISASAPVKPADEYTLNSLVDGTVIFCEKNEGDTVKKDEILYQFEDKDTQKEINKANKAVDEAIRNYDKIAEGYEKLSVKATEEGQVISLDVKLGDEVSAGQIIGKIENRKVMVLEVPFLAIDAGSFMPGQQAEVIIDSSFEKLKASVLAVSRLEEVGVGNSIVKKVKLQLANPGGIKDGTKASAYVGASACNEIGEIKYKFSGDILSEGTGKVMAINAQVGDSVYKDQRVVSLSSEDIDEQLKIAQESIDAAKEEVKRAEELKNNYIYKSQVDGTVIERTAKVGDNIKSGTTLMTIYDMSYLTFTLNVMEEDIKKISVGQDVNVYGSYDELFMGTVTRVGINGKSNEFSTTYPVTVKVEESEGLLPGMNVRAEILTDYAQDVLMAPVSAVVRGNLVLVTTDSPSAANDIGEIAPEGYVYVPVEVGLSNKDYVEIISGLEEGDTVGYTPNMGGDDYYNMYPDEGVYEETY